MGNKGKMNKLEEKMSMLESTLSSMKSFVEEAKSGSEQIDELRLGVRKLSVDVQARIQVLRESQSEVVLETTKLYQAGIDSLSSNLRSALEDTARKILLSTTEKINGL